MIYLSARSIVPIFEVSLLFHQTLMYLLIMTSSRLVSLLVSLYFLSLLHFRLLGQLFSGVSCFVCTEHFPLCTNEVLLPLPFPPILTFFDRKFSLPLLSLVGGAVWRFCHDMSSGDTTAFEFLTLRWFSTTGRSF